MLIYVDEVQREIDDILVYARLISEKFDAGREAKELLLDAKALDVRVENLYAMLPEGGMIGSALRHTRFMIYYLERDDPKSCAGDILAICEYDLPGVREALRDWSSKLAWVDADLRRDILPLIRFCQFDSAIRKAFVILKTRLCRKFGLDETIDGDELVNAIFGQNSPHLSDLSRGEKAAYRNIFAGMFGLLRNRFAHNDVQPDLSDLDTALANVNLCLRIVGDFRTTDSARGGSN
jgi:Protein of unknown function (Hypoth_ymh)